MKFNTLTKIVDKKGKRLGRGYGSGRGKTSGRGTKGQKARGTIKYTFEGGQLPLTKRLPFLRGKKRNQPHGKKAVVINVKELNNLAPNTVVDIDGLIKNKILPAEFKSLKSLKIKILGDGELKIPLTIKLPVSKGAKTKIEKAGGKCE